MAKDYYEIVKYELIRGQMIMDMPIPQEIIRYLYDKFDADKEMTFSYRNHKFAEPQYEKLKQWLEIWDSPLMRALE